VYNIEEAIQNKNKKSARKIFDVVFFSTFENNPSLAPSNEPCMK
jgi:hypothetical protein